MKRALFPPLPLLLFAVNACRPKGDRLTGESARQAAERYFNMLIQGQYEQYVNGMVSSADMSAELRSQMTDLLSQFCESQQLDRAMLSAQATADSLQDSSAYVRLDVLHGDSTTEEVGMPLVFSGGRWLMQ